MKIVRNPLLISQQVSIISIVSPVDDSYFLIDIMSL